MIKAKVIKPVNVVTQGIFRSEMLAEANKIASDMNKDFQKTTATWKNKPKFDTKVMARDQKVSITVSTSDEIYGYVDKGTRPHIIRPRKRDYPLRFNSRFKAKTKPHFIGSSNGASNPPIIRAMEVHHPGNEPRYFVRDIQAKYQPILAKRMQIAITRAAKKTKR